MRVVPGLTWLLGCQLAGEVLAHATGAPVPGAVLGMVVLLVVLLVVVLVVAFASGISVIFFAFYWVVSVLFRSLGCFSFCTRCGRWWHQKS